MYYTELIFGYLVRDYILIVEKINSRSSTYLPRPTLTNVGLSK